MAKGRRQAFGIAAAAIALLAAHAARYRDYFTDDAYISLRYAQRLLDGHGLTWTDGPAVEGYSNLSFVLACALLGALGMDLEHAARVLGFAGMGAALLAVVFAHRRGRGAQSLPALFGALALALSGCVAVWAIGGLEQGMLAAFLAWALATTLPRLDDPEAEGPPPWIPGLFFALACVTRPDAPLFAAVAVLFVAGTDGPRAGSRALRLAAFPAAATLGQLGFRLAYYGDWLPNTAYARIALDAGQIPAGLAYLWQGALPLAGLLLPALGALALAARPGVRRRRVALLGATLLAWCGYLAVIGGDFFAGRRQFVPIAVLCAFLAAELWAALTARPRLAVGAWAVALACLVGLAAGQLADEQHARARRETWPEKGRAVGGLLARAFGEARPLLAVDAAGSLPYFAGLPALDMLGLNDRHIARHRMPDVGAGDAILGHQLGDPAYVLARDPDLIVFCSAKGRERPCFAAGRALVRSPDFQRRYRPVRFMAGPDRGTRADLWVRTASEKIGVRRAGGGVLVPGYLFGRAGAPAELDGAGRLGVRLRAGDPARFEGLALAPGDWAIRIESDAPVALEVSQPGAARTQRVASGGRLAIADGGPITLTLHASAPRAHVRALRFEPGA